MQSNLAARLAITSWLVLAMPIASLAVAQDFPTRPITIVVPFPPGASTDATARTMQNRLKELLGQPIVVENRPGAGGSVGSAFVAKSRPDGYTLLLVVNTVFTASPTLMKTPLFDPVKDFQQISKLSTTSMLLAVNPLLPVQNMKEFVKYVREHPDKLSYATAGVGSGHHIAGELLKQAAGIEMIAVPYRGGGPAITDLLGGHIKVAMAVLPAVMPYLNTDKIRVLASLDKTRSPLLPNVPTVSETVPGVEMNSWTSLAAPAGTPPAIISQLNKAVREALNSEETKRSFLKQGLVVETSTPEAMTDELKAEIATLTKVIEKAGIPKE